MNSWWSLACMLLLVFLGKPILVNILIFIKMRAFRLTPPSSRIIPREETPPATAAVLNNAGAELESLGFRFEHAAIHVPTQGETYKKPLWVYVHAESFVYASVQTIQLRSGALIPLCGFTTFLEDGREVQSSSFANKQDSTEILVFNPVQELPVGEQFQQHLEFVRKSGKAKYLPVPEALYAETNRVWHEAMQLRLKRGQVVRLAENRFAYSFMESVRRALNASAKVRKLNKSKINLATAKKLASDSSAQPSLNEEIEQYRNTVKISGIPSLGIVTKLILLLVSMGLFCLAFHMSISWKSVLLLLGVLTFHEGGHLLGMRLFGYKNLQMLYLPFLGAVAIGGKREYQAPWKELVVLFLGPLPGFFIGIAVLTAPFFEKIPMRHELGYMLIGLNLFNLLPIHPLDGGQIMDILLLRRSPFFRALFLGLGAAALFAAGAFGLFGVAFLVFGGLLLRQFPAQMRQARLVGALRKQFGSSLSQQSEDTILTSTFEFLRNQPAKLALQAKLSFVRGILAQYKSDPAGAGTLLFGLVAYTSPIWVSLAGLAVHGVQSRAEISKATRDGLLVSPVETIGANEADASPIMLKIEELVKTRDVDLKFAAIKRHISTPGSNREELGKAISDPDVGALVSLARQAANANYSKMDFKPGMETPLISEITEWLVLSAICAAENADEKTAWSDLEAALRSVRLKTVTISEFRPMVASWSLGIALDGMQKVMLRLSPGAEETARLRELISAHALGHAILGEQIENKIRVVQHMMDNHSRANGHLSLLMYLLVHAVTPDPKPYLREIQDLKERQKLADSNPNVSEETVFGSGKIDPVYSGEFGSLLSQLRLAETALALEEYRNAHGTTPEELTALESLTAHQREEIHWDKKLSLLKAPSPRDYYRSTTSSIKHALVREATEDDEDGADDENDLDPYTWKIRPASG